MPRGHRVWGCSLGSYIVGQWTVDREKAIPVVHDPFWFLAVLCGVMACWLLGLLHGMIWVAMKVGPGMARETWGDHIGVWKWLK